MKIKKAKEVVQSYLLTTARRYWGLYAERLLLRLVEVAQCDIEGIDFKNGTDMKPHTPSLNYPMVTRNTEGDAIVSLPIKSLFPDKGYINYKYIHEAIEELQSNGLSWEETKTDKNGNIIRNKQGQPVRQWISLQLAGRAEGEDSESGYVTVRINPDIWKAMLDFSKGFRAFDINVAMNLRSKYSLRLYQLISCQENPLTVTIDELKKQWVIEDKYPSSDDFIQSIIYPAQEELDAVSPYTFDFEPVISDEPGIGWKPIIAITFYPKHQLDCDET